MEPNIVYAWLFIGAVLFSWLTGYIIIRKWPGGTQLSMSGHGASHHHAYAVFASSLTITAVITFVFLTGWLVPTFNLHPSLKIVAFIFAVLQLITAWVPDVPVIKRRVHRWAAYSLAGLMPVELAYLIFSPHISMFARVISGMVVLGMFAVIYIQIFRKNLHRYFLIYQTLYVICCQLAITATILVRK